MKLFLPLTKYWFNEIATGRKTVEYRSMTQHWRKRIWEKRFILLRVIFSCGYSGQQITCFVKEIDIGSCPYFGWDGEFYRIHFEGRESLGEVEHLPDEWAGVDNVTEK